MSEIQSAADLYWIRWFIAGLVSAVISLIVYIVRAIKKSVDEIKLTVKENKKEQETDHDRIDKIETKVNIFHPENTMPPSDLHKK